MKELKTIIKDAQDAYGADDKVKLKKLLEELDGRPGGITQSIYAELRLSPLIVSNILDEEPEVITPVVSSNQPSLTLQEIAEELKSLSRIGAKNILETGRLLDQAKKEMVRGQFKPWLSTHTSFSKSHAYDLMRTYNTFKDQDIGEWEHMRPELLHQVARFSNHNGMRDTVSEALSVASKVDADVTVSTMQSLQSVLIGVADADVESLSTIIQLLADTDSRRLTEAQLKGVKHKSQPTSSNELLVAFEESLVEAESSSVVDFPSPETTARDMTQEEYKKILDATDDVFLEGLEYPVKYSQDAIRQYRVEDFASETKGASNKLWACLGDTSTEELARALLGADVNFSKLDAFIDKLSQVRDAMEVIKQTRGSNNGSF